MKKDFMYSYLQNTHISLCNAILKVDFDTIKVNSFITYSTCLNKVILYKYPVICSIIQDSIIICSYYVLKSNFSS